MFQQYNIPIVFFVPSFCTPMNRSLRRTLQRQQCSSAFYFSPSERGAKVSISLTASCLSVKPCLLNSITER